MSSSRSTSRSARTQLHTLTAHEQYQPVEIGPPVDENGVERKVDSGSAEAPRQAQQATTARSNQIPKPTVEEYKEITSGHGHH